MTEQDRQPLEETQEVADAVADDVAVDAFITGGGTDSDTPKFQQPGAKPWLRTGAEQPWEPVDLAVAKGWGLLPVGVYGLFAGVGSIIVGVRIINLSLTQAPVPSGVGFILTGSAGVLVLAALLLPRQRLVRTLSVLTLLAAAALWAYTAYSAYWVHLEMFKKWVPLTMPAA